MADGVTLTTARHPVAGKKPKHRLSADALETVEVEVRDLTTETFEALLVEIAEAKARGVKLSINPTVAIIRDASPR